MTMVLPEPVAILQHWREKSAAITGNLDSHPLGGRRFGQPDNGFNRLQLTEKETAGFMFFGVAPVFQQAFGDAAHARIIRFAPGFDPRADLIDQRNFNKDAGIIKGFGAFRGDDIAGGAAPFNQIEEARFDDRSASEAAALRKVS